MSDDTSMTVVKPIAFPSHGLLSVLGLTFAISWGLIGLMLVFPEWTAARFGDVTGSHPFFVVAAIAPAFSALVMVYYYCGVPGLISFLSRVLMWRSSSIWAVFVLVGTPLVFVFASLLKSGWSFPILPEVGVWGSVVAAVFFLLVIRYEWLFGSHFWSLYTVATVPLALIAGAYVQGEPLLAATQGEGLSVLIYGLALVLLLGPIEEFGWRGVVLPILQRYMAPLWAGTIVGAIWGLWHLPAYFLPGFEFSNWNFPAFLIGSIALAIIVTPIFNKSRGSLLWPMLFHWQVVNPLWPDAHPYDTWVLVLVAVLVVWWNHKEMLHKKDAITHVT